jgi:hypothetical protein
VQESKGPRFALPPDTKRQAEDFRGRPAGCDGGPRVSNATHMIVPQRLTARPPMWSDHGRRDAVRSRRGSRNPSAESKGSDLLRHQRHSVIGLAAGCTARLASLVASLRSAVTGRRSSSPERSAALGRPDQFPRQTRGDTAQYRLIAASLARDTPISLFISRFVTRLETPPSSWPGLSRQSTPSR